MRSILSALLRALVSFVGLLVVCLIGLHAYLAYEADAAGELLQNLQSLRLGQSEASALWLSQKYGGVKWVNKYKPDYDNSDYEYAVQVNPWHYDTVLGDTSKVHRVIRSLVKETRPEWRHALGLRKWLVAGNIRIRAGQVESVSGQMIAEGKDKWLGGEWNLVPVIPPDRVAHGGPTFAVNSGHLLWDDEGQFLQAWLIPAVGISDARTARDLNLMCLNYRSGCTGFSELMPGAAAEYKSHP
jgi:hypothetical protein